MHGDGELGCAGAPLPIFEGVAEGVGQRVGAGAQGINGSVAVVDGVGVGAVCGQNQSAVCAHDAGGACGCHSGQSTCACGVLHGFGAAADDGVVAKDVAGGVGAGCAVGCATGLDRDSGVVAGDRRVGARTVHDEGGRGSGEAAFTVCDFVSGNDGFVLARRYGAENAVFGVDGQCAGNCIKDRDALRFSGAGRLGRAVG